MSGFEKNAKYLVDKITSLNNLERELECLIPDLVIIRNSYLNKNHNQYISIAEGFVNDYEEKLRNLRISLRGIRILKSKIDKILKGDSVFDSDIINVNYAMNQECYYYCKSRQEIGLLAKKIKDLSGKFERGCDGPEDEYIC